MQLDEEGVVAYLMVDYGDWGAYRKKLERDGIPYISFPLSAGRATACEYGTTPLPPIDGIVEWIVGSTPGKRISTSHKFGGDHAGARADPNPDRYAHSNKDLGTVLAEVKDKIEFRHKLESEAMEKIDLTSDMVVHLPPTIDCDVKEAMSQ